MPTPPFRNQPSARDHYGIKWPKAVAKVTDDFDVLLAFYDYSAEHSIHLAPPIESTFATVRLRPRVAKGPGFRSAGVTMAFKLIESSTDPVLGRQRTPPCRAGPCRRGLQKRRAHRPSPRRIRGW